MSASQFGNVINQIRNGMVARTNVSLLGCAFIIHFGVLIDTDIYNCIFSYVLMVR